MFVNCFAPYDQSRSWQPKTGERTTSIACVPGWNLCCLLRPSLIPRKEPTILSLSRWSAMVPCTCTDWTGTRYVLCPGFVSNDFLAPDVHFRLRLPQLTTIGCMLWTVCITLISPPSPPPWPWFMDQLSVTLWRLMDKNEDDNSICQWPCLVFEPEATYCLNFRLAPQGVSWCLSCGSTSRSSRASRPSCHVRVVGFNDPYSKVWRLVLSRHSIRKWILSLWCSIFVNVPKPEFSSHQPQHTRNFQDLRGRRLGVGKDEVDVKRHPLSVNTRQSPCGLKTKRIFDTSEVGDLESAYMR